MREARCKAPSGARDIPLRVSRSTCIPTPPRGALADLLEGHGQPRLLPKKGHGGSHRCLYMSTSKLAFGATALT